MLKRSLKKILRAQGYLLYRLRDRERRASVRNDLELRHFLYREALVLSSGEINTSEAHFLGELVSACDKQGAIVEIGSLYGYSTSVIVNHKPPSQRVISVDNYSWNPLGFPSDTHFSIIKERLKDAVKNHRLEIVREDKSKFFSKYKGGPPALVFLDADHSYEETLKDIRWAQAVGAGVICGHDYHEEKFPGVVQAVEESGGVKKRIDTLWLLA